MLDVEYRPAEIYLARIILTIERRRESLRRARRATADDHYSAKSPYRRCIGRAGESGYDARHARGRGEF